MSLNIKDQTVRASTQALYSHIESEITRALYHVWPNGYSNRDVIARCNIERRGHQIEYLQVDGVDVLEIHPIVSTIQHSGQGWTPHVYRIEFRFRRLYEKASS